MMGPEPSRRQLLKAAAACVLTPPSSLFASATQPASFAHRGYLGWITDLATQPDVNAAWPSMRLDEALLHDYDHTFETMKALGFNEISIWGLYVSRAWPVDLRSAVPAERGRMVERLIAAAHARGIRVFSGLGVYSWGFEQIIRAHPEVARGSREVMCGSDEGAWTWMKKVVDYAFERFPIDGVSMQSADQGRCACPACRNKSDAEYHAMLNIRVAEYIRSRWPGKTIGINGWGMRFNDPATLGPLVDMSRHVDYIIDVGNTCRWAGTAHRKRVAAELKCAFGTIGGPQVEPPQHWARDRWFLPTLRRTAEHIIGLYADGGRACEYFFHVAANPGDDLSMRLAGRCLREPLVAWRSHALRAVAEVFRVPDGRAADVLDLCLRAEDAYWSHRADVAGTLSLEPLVSNRPGPPVYLHSLNAAARTHYRAALVSLRTAFAVIAREADPTTRLHQVLRCIDNVVADLDRSL